LIPRSALYVLIAVVAFSLVVPAFASSIFVFERSPTLEKSLGTSTFAPQVAVDGDDVYSVFIEQSPTHILRFETTNVNTPTSYSGVDVWDGFGTTMSNPEIFVASNGDIYTAFQEDVDGLLAGDIIYVTVVRSTDSGATFPIGASCLGLPDAVGINTDDLIGAGENFKIAADAGEVYIAYIDGTDLYFVSDTYVGDGCGFYTGEFTVDTTDTVTNLDMIYNGTNIYIAYEINAAGTKEVKLATSTNGGTSFATITNLSNSAGVDSTEPKLSLSGDYLYVTWQENTGANSEVHFMSYDASTTTFGSDTRLDDSAVTAASVTPQIASSGSNVYAVWADKVDSTSNNQEIVMRKSADSGANFASSVSISSSTADSLNPKISAEGNNLNIVWQDQTIDGTNGELWFRTSADSGATFGGLQIISETALTPVGTDLIGTDLTIPEISSSSSATAVVWKIDATGGLTYAKPANVTNIDVSFDKIEYANATSATITVRDTSASGSVNVGVLVNGASESTENLSGSAGVFTGIITTGVAGDVLRVNYPTDSGNFTTFAKVFGTRDLAWVPSIDPLVVGNLYGLTVTDASANTNPFVNDTVTVTITTTADGGAPDLDTDTVVLTETNTNTGIFSGTENITFMPGDYTPNISDNIVATLLNDTIANDLLIETNSRVINSTSDPTGVTITLTETSLTSNEYKATFSFCETPGCSDAATKTIYAQAGDLFGMSTPVGTHKTHGIIEPISSDRRALLVNDFLASEVDISVNGLSVLNVGLDDSLSPGGGGGGISRAGLVVQAVGAIATFGGGGSGSTGPPSFTNEHFSINTGGITLSEDSSSGTTSSFNVGEESNLQIDFRLPAGYNDLDHIGLYANIGPGQDKYDSDTYIYFDKYKTPQITIHDPHGFFNSVDIDVTEPKQSYLEVDFVFDFAKSLEDNDVIFEAWNLQRQSALKEIPDLLDVIDDTIPEIEDEPVPEVIVEEVQQKTPVPEWIKSNILTMIHLHKELDIFYKIKS
jgi:hypothetical protein